MSFSSVADKIRAGSATVVGVPSQAYVIVPVYNEAGNIGKVLATLERLSEKMSLHAIVVDDGSTDGTLAEVEQFRGRLRLDLVQHRVNQGICRTFYDGLMHAAMAADDDAAIVLIEGDDTSDLQVFSAMVERIAAGGDLVIASRHVNGGKYLNFPLWRTLGSSLVNALLRVAFHIHCVSDYTIFYRAYRARVLKNALAKHGDRILTVKSFAANIELLLRLEPFITRVDEVPLVYDYSRKHGKSKMNTLHTLAECLRLVFQRWRGLV